MRFLLNPSALESAHRAQCVPALALCCAVLLYSESICAQSWQNQVVVSVRGDYISIQANGIPDHQHGTFPNAGNPNYISPQRHQFRLPVHPQRARRITPLGLGPFGVAVNGVPFDPGAAEFWNGAPRPGWQ